MPTDFDAVVIGSGFGGAVSALRLAEGGYRVLVLERGRRWHRLEYPSVTRSDWLWDEAHPERTNGWLDIRNHGNISTVAGDTTCFQGVRFRWGERRAGITE